MGEVKMNIYEKLHVIQTTLKATKGQWNKFGNYSYRSCEDILESVKPLLVQTKTILTICDELVMIGDRYYIKATAKLQDTEVDASYGVDGFAREEEEKKGMDGSQITGAASSYARKYALNGLLCIDDNKDADVTNTHGKEEKKPTPKKAPYKKLEKMLDKELGEMVDTVKKQLTEAQIKRLYTIASKKGFNDDQVKVVIKKEYKKDSTNDLSKKEYDELVKRLEAK